MGRNLAPVSTLIRAQRELKMVRRTVILMTVLATISFPYAIFVFMGFFNHAPKYALRISYAFGDLAALAIEIVLFHFTDPLKEAVMKRIKLRSNQIVPTMT
jgi:Na+/phosphate symporter